MILDVARTKTKTEMLTIRVSPTVYAEFQAACENRGISMSGLLHLRIVETIREERDHNPGIFAQTLARIYREKHQDELDMATEEPRAVGSPASRIEHPEEIRSLEDVQKVTRRKAHTRPKKQSKKRA